MKRILVVDDSMFMRMSIKTILTRNGYTVVGEAENGAIGVTKYKELCPELMTLDITMKEMTGLEALKEIISFDADAKVVMVSAMGQDSIIREALDLGAKGFLIKPFKEEDVLSTMQRLMPV